MRPSVITTSTRHRYKKPTSCCSNIPSFHLLHFPVSHPFILHPPDRLRELADTHFSLLLPPSLFFLSQIAAEHLSSPPSFPFLSTADVTPKYGDPLFDERTGGFLTQRIRFPALD